MNFVHKTSILYITQNTRFKQEKNQVNYHDIKIHRYMPPGSHINPTTKKMRTPLTIYIEPQFSRHDNFTKINIEKKHVLGYEFDLGINFSVRFR